jgi:hypothetical protein
MTKIKQIMMSLLAIFFALALVACDGPAEEAGEEIDEANEEIEESMEETGDWVEEETE